MMMISNLRLLLGLTSFRLKRWLSQRSSIGPSGIFESSIKVYALLFQDTGHDRERERDIAGDDDRREAGGEVAAPRVEAPAVPSHALEQAPGTVIQVHSQGEVGQDVEDRDE